MQETNLKISPYFDDFNSSKNYQKVLFKPGYSVQTRELNTLQSTLQNQIEKFGQHVFKDGSIVIPGNVNYDLSAKTVMIQSLINGVSVENNITALIGKTLTGADSAVRAEVTGVLTAAESEKDTTTLYVSYNYGGNEENGTQLKEFKNNEVLQDSDGNPVAVTTVQNATSYTGSTVNINAGVYFVRGFFVEVLSQKIILDQYNTKPSYKVGLQIIESVVTAEEDGSLYDNSLGTTNYASPGADRLKIELKLVKQNLLLTENSNFIELLRFEEGKITQQADAYQSAYAQLEKNLARRTYANHGSFTTQPYTIKIREALNNGENGGVYFANEISYDGKTIVEEIPTGATAVNIGANEYTDGTSNFIVGKDYYAIELSEGKAYVEGFEVLNERKQYALVPKPRSTQSLNNQGSILQIGSHIKISASTGTVNFNEVLLLKDVGGNTIGTAKSIGLANKKLYLREISLYETLTVSDVADFATGDFVTGSVSGATAFADNVNGGDPSTIRLRQISGTFIVGDKLINSRVASSPTVPECSVTSISRKLLENVRTIEKNTGFSATVKLDSVSLTGSSFTVSGDTSLTGVNTAFNFELSADSRIKLGGETAVEVTTVTSSTVTLSANVTNGTYYSASKQVCKLYSSSTGLTSRVSLNPISEESDYVHNRLITQTQTASGTAITLQASPGDLIDKSTIVIVSSTGIVDNSTLTFSQSDSHTLGITGLANESHTIYYQVRVSNPTTRKKTKRSYKFLKIDKEKTTANNVYGTRYVDKELSLVFPDVIKIHAIHEALTAASSNTAMFDSVLLNDASNIKEGDILTLGSVRARVVSKDGNKAYIVYLSTTKFQSGTNLALSINVPGNNLAVGIFITECTNGKYRDVTDDYKLVKNDTADIYRVSKLVRKSSAAEPQKKIIVVYDYFEHSDLGNDFYSADSYGDLTYDEIPLAYNYVSMADLIDFRYYTTPSTTSGGTISSPYVETVSALDITTRSISSGKVPFPESVFGLDYKFYMGRVDKVYLTASSEKYGYITGQLRVVQGADSIDPALADDEGAGLLLATIKLPPYLKNVSEAQITLEKTRNYTMKDIGKLEERLTNLEEYTSLSLLEVSTNNLNVLDDEGKNRFKNGFVVDSFTTTDVADLANPDYSASIDLDKNIVRPYPVVNSSGFYYDASLSTTKFNRTYITLPFTETPLISQTYSSRVENLFPYEVFSWVGNMDLFPKKDIWYDTQREIVEGQNINLVDSYTALFDLVVPGGQIWGDWDLGAGGSDRGGGGTTITDIMSGTQFDISSLNFDIQSGDTIQNISDIKYTRSRIVNVNTTLLRPNTRFYFYVNDVESNNIIYPNLLTNLTEVSGTFVVGEKVDLIPRREVTTFGRDSQPLNRLSATVVDPSLFTDDTLAFYSSLNGYSANTTKLAISDLRSLDDPATNAASDINPTIIGTDFIIVGRTSRARARSKEQQPLYSDEYGNLNAFVLIPPTMFETGDLTFSVSDVPGNLQVKGITASYAIGQYYTQGTQLNVTSQVTTLEVPELTATAITRERTRFIPDPPPAPAGHDPIAQSFFIGEEGTFVTSLDLFFLTKDQNQPVTVDIRTMENGTPTSYIVPGSITTVESADVKTSTDASVPTRFTFDNPLYLSSNVSYSFIVRTTNKNYNLWVSRLGESDVTTGLMIDKQPYVGVLYKSSNQSIWTPDQYEDVKFILNRAKFETNTTFVATLPNDPVVDQKLTNNPFTFTENSSIIKVFQTNHGMNQLGNKVRIDAVLSDIINAQLTSTISGAATTISITDIAGTANFDPSSEGWNVINNAPVTAANPGYVKIDDEIISYTGVATSQLTGCVRGQFGTEAVSHENKSVVECFQLNGILLSDINKVHTITKVISADEYEITVPNSANLTKQSGGINAVASRNTQYETIKPKFNIFSPPNTNAIITAGTTSGTSIGNANQRSFQLRGAESIDNYVENTMNEPKIILSESNKTAFQPSTSGSLTAYVNMSSTSDMVSPVLDLAGSSIITISNRINKEVDGDDNIDVTSELTPTGGKHSSYITKKVILETSGTSVKVLFDAIRTEHNDIKVFVKVKGDSTPGSFDDMNYEEIPSVSYPVSKNNKEFRSFDFEVKSLREFQEFSIKVVMIGNDQSDVPKIRNFRALALAL